MGSVKFVDTIEIRKKKNKIRAEMLEIMNTFPEWYKSKVLTGKIQLLGEKLGSIEMGESHPIESIDREKFTMREYKALHELGYTDKDIYIALGMTKSVFIGYRGVR